MRKGRLVGFRSSEVGDDKVVQRPVTYRIMLRDISKLVGSLGGLSGASVQTLLASLSPEERLTIKCVELPSRILASQLQRAATYKFKNDTFREC